MVSIAASSFWTRIIVEFQNNGADYGGLVEVDITIRGSSAVLFRKNTSFTTQGIHHMRSGDEQMNQIAYSNRRGDTSESEGMAVEGYKTIYYHHNVEVLVQSMVSMSNMIHDK